MSKIRCRIIIRVLIQSRIAEPISCIFWTLDFTFRADCTQGKYGIRMYYRLKLLWAITCTAAMQPPSSLLIQTSVHPTQMTLTGLQETRAASQDVIEFSGEMKPGQITNQLKQAVSKPGHVNKLCYWFVNLKVSCCYKPALIG